MGGPRGGFREGGQRGGGPEGGARAEGAPRPEAEKVTVAADGANVRFLRFAPGSMNQADAVPGTFPDIRVGDDIRVLGNREGSRLKVEQPTPRASAARPSRWTRRTTS